MRKNKIQWLAAAVIILAVGLVILGVIISRQRSGNDAVDIALPDPSSASSFSESSTWPVEDTEELNLVRLTTDNVRTVIKIMKRPQVYTFSAITSVYYGDSERRINASQWILDGSTVTLKSDEKLKTKTYIIRSEGFVTMWQDGDTTAYTCAEGLFDDDDTVGIPTYETLLENDKAILQAEYRMYGEDLCIFVRTGKSASTYDDFYIGVDSGLLLHSETYSGNELIYSMSLTEWSEDVSEAEGIIPPA